MEKSQNQEKLDSQLADVGLDATDMYGNVTKLGADKSLSHSTSEYDESSNASGMADDPYLGGSTGTADDVGMHIEPGFSIGYDSEQDLDFDGDTGNEIEGGYLSLADAAQGREISEDDGSDLQTALGGPDAVQVNTEDNMSIDSVTDEEESYGAEGTDSDLDDDQAV